MQLKNPIKNKKFKICYYSKKIKKKFIIFRLDKK